MLEKIAKKKKKKLHRSSTPCAFFFPLGYQIVTRKALLFFDFLLKIPFVPFPTRLYLYWIDNCSFFSYSDKKWWTMLTFRVLQLANLAKIRLLLAIWVVWLVLRPYVLSLEQLKGFCWFWDLYFIIFGISYIRIETYVIHIYNIWQNSFE